MLRREMSPGQQRLEFVAEYLSGFVYVTELARVLTGWSIERPEEGGGFRYRPFLHDRQPKTVLGIRFAAGGGIEEGEKMIHILAHEPATDLQAKPAQHVRDDARLLVRDDAEKVARLRLAGS